MLLLQEVLGMNLAETIVLLSLAVWYEQTSADIATLGPISKIGR